MFAAVVRSLRCAFLTNPFRVTKPIRRPRLGVEGLEGRDCPATFYWVGDVDNLYIKAANWTQSADPTNKPDAPSAPPPGSDLRFDDRYSSANCFWGNGPSQHKSLILQNGYTGTVTLGPGTTVETFDLQSGKVDQASTSVLTVTKLMQWIGGELDSTPATPSQVVVSGGGTIATILTRTGAGDTVLQTAATLRVENGARVEFGFGTVRFTAGAGLYLTGPTTTADVRAAPDRQLVFENAVVPSHGAVVYLEDSAKYTVTQHAPGPAGLHTSGLAFRNSGGQLRIEGGVQMTVTGNIPGPGPVSAGIRQSYGGTRLTTGSALVVPAGLAYTGGSFTTFVNVDGSMAAIQGDMYNDGASVLFLRANANFFGTLEVRGTVDWVSGIYFPGIGLVNGQRRADLWRATGQITAGTQAFVSHQGGDIPVGQNVTILESDAQIVGGPPAQDLFDARYAILGNGNPVNQWVLRRTS